MNKRIVMWIGAGLLLALVVIGISSAGTIWSRGPAEAGQSPVEVVESFYALQAEAIANGNGVSQGYYREMPMLTEDLIARVDEIVAGFSRGGYDPLACAQDFPLERTYALDVVEGDRARVTVSNLYTGNPTASVFAIVLRRVEGQWKIDEIRCQDRTLRPLTAEETVAGFYGMYLQTCEQRNPLAEGIYQHLPFLAPEFVQKVDAVRTENGWPYDPILQAQDVPQSIDVTESVVEGDRARVIAETSFDAHSIAIELVQRDGQWWIVDVARAE